MALLRRHRVVTLPPPLLLAFLLAASFHGSASGDDRYDPNLCLWRPSTCGSVTINYPFHLYDKTAALRGYNGSYCGYPGFAVRCEDGKQAVLQLEDETYKVLSINYTGKTVSLFYQEVLEYERCPRVDHNVTLPPASWLNFPADYLLFFLNCTADLVGSIHPIICDSFGGQTAGSSFVWPGNEVPPPELVQACPRVIKLPVLELPRGPKNDSQWINGGYGDALRSGFQLAWDQGMPSECKRCEDSVGRCGFHQAAGFLGCLCPGGRLEPQNCTASSGRNKRIAIIAGVVGGSVLLVAAVIAFFIIRQRKLKKGINSSSKLLKYSGSGGTPYGPVLSKTKDAPNIESFLQNNRNIYPKRYTYTDVKRMTKSFDVKLGQGGFGAVYRGNLPDGREIAVKMLKDNKGDGEEFMNEVASISRTSHVNVVTLLGFCLQGSKRALIYEYMPKGSLERYAFNRNFNTESTLAWEKLFEIAIGIARGLEYLHRGCNTRIVHFDIKPHNILLDQDFCPKISDFGLAKLCVNKESAISIGGARGTIGYIAPEVYSKQFGTVSSKSDVYSYGMMVLEIVGARDKNNNNTNNDSSSQYFPQWVYEHLDDYCISASEINGETTEFVRKMIVVGLWCIQVTPTHRPTMTRVVEMLEGSTRTLELPPNMFLS